MRIRTIKPSFWTDAKVASLPERTRLLFIGLWHVADDSGLLRDDHRELAATILPYEPTAEREASTLLALRQLEAAGMIGRYVVDGRPYIIVTNFLRHQVIQRPTPSRLPPPPDALRGPNAAASPRRPASAPPPTPPGPPAPAPSVCHTMQPSQAPVYETLNEPSGTEVEGEVNRNRTSVVGVGGSPARGAREGTPPTTPPAGSGGGKTTGRERQQALLRRLCLASDGDSVDQSIAICKRVRVRNEAEAAAFLSWAVQRCPSARYPRQLLPVAPEWAEVRRAMAS